MVCSHEQDKCMACGGREWWAGRCRVGSGEAWGKGEAGGPPAGRSAEDTHPGPLPSSPCCPSRQPRPPPPVQDSSRSMFLSVAI